MSGARRVGIAVAAAALLLGGLGACSIFGPTKPKPQPLEAYTAALDARPAWRSRFENVQFPLSIGTSPGVFTVAGSDGTVLALQTDTGRELWRGSVGEKIGAGVGSDGRFAAAVTRNGELVTLEAGRVLWRKPLGLSVATAPLVAGERVFVLGVDRSVHAFDAQDGTKLWSVQRPGDPLTLSQASVLAAFKDTLLVSQGPRLAGLDPNTGTLRWEVPVATPRGTNEVERLADLVAPLARVGDVVCTRAFQAAVGCVNADRGALVWSKNVGGNDGVAADDQLVIAADASDRITAWKTVNGDVAWATDKLLHRGLGPPVAIGKAVLFGDAEGTLHFLARDTGATLLRVPTDGSPVVAAPVLSNGTLLVVTRAGGLFAFRPE